MDTIDDIAGRLERAADRYHNAADFKSKNDALQAAQAVRRARSVMEAQQIEQAFLRTHPPDGGRAATFTQDQQQQQPSGCLGGWFNIFSGGGGRSGPWRSSVSGPRYTSSYYYDTWTSRDFVDLTFTDALLRSVPPHVHDRRAYVRQVSQQTGIDPNARVGDLSGDQISAISSQIAGDWQSSAGSFGSAGADFGSAGDSSRGDDSSRPHSFSSTGRDFGSADDSAPSGAGGSFGSSGGDFGSGDDSSGGGSFGSSGNDFGSSSPSDNS
jgi:hypothetical protein